MTSSKTNIFTDSPGGGGGGGGGGGTWVFKGVHTEYVRKRPVTCGKAAALLGTPVSTTSYK